MSITDEHSLQYRALSALMRDALPEILETAGADFCVVFDAPGAMEICSAILERKRDVMSKGPAGLVREAIAKSLASREAEVIFWRHVVLSNYGFRVRAEARNKMIRRWQELVESSTKTMRVGAQLERLGETFLDRVRGFNPPEVLPEHISGKPLDALVGRQRFVGVGGAPATVEAPVKPAEGVEVWRRDGGMAVVRLYADVLKVFNGRRSQQVLISFDWKARFEGSPEGGGVLFVKRRPTDVHVPGLLLGGPRNNRGGLEFTTKAIESYGVDLPLDPTDVPWEMWKGILLIGFPKEWRSKTC